MRVRLEHGQVVRVTRAVSSTETCPTCSQTLHRGQYKTRDGRHACTQCVTGKTPTPCVWRVP